jgi:hypothetical protein
VKKIAIALLLGSMFAVGCGDKGTDGGKSGSAAASGSSKGPAQSKVCEEYWTKSKACNEASMKAMPDGPAKDSMKKTLEDSEKTTRESWKNLEGKALDDACKQMVDALASNPNCPK